MRLGLARKLVELVALEATTLETTAREDRSENLRGLVALAERTLRGLGLLEPGREGRST